MLIAGVDDANRALQELLIEAENVIAGNAEDVPHPVRVKSLNQILANGRRLFHAGLRGNFVFLLHQASAIEAKAVIGRRRVHKIKSAVCAHAVGLQSVPVHKVSSCVDGVMTTGFARESQ